MSKTVRLKVITPSKRLFDEDVDMVVVRGTEGDMGVLPGCENRVAALGYGALRAFGGGGEMKPMAVLGGFVEILSDTVTVLSDAAEWADEIDASRAEAAKLRAERRLQKAEDGVDIQRAELALRRALVRIEVSSYPLIKDRRS
ncbi:MAG: ATP synthase F1 subunit epsilon [Firmicutes bacterium]|nr:ATP synthase F1 subunit epsilon [Bacillota bacterium]